MSDTLFTDDQSGTGGDTDYLKTVVDAKGDQWNDPQVIAKGYLSAQAHIEKLEAEAAHLKEKATKNDYMEEVLKRFDERGKPAGGEPKSNTNNTSTNDGADQPVSVEQIKNLVAETLTEAETKRTASQNIAESKRLMQEAFGTEGQAAITKVMQETGMSKERMDQLASESPSAFMRMLGKPVQKQTNQNTQGTVNTSNMQHESGKQNWAYWQKMRRENPKEYRKPATQAAMLKARESMSSEDFYGTA